MWGIEFKHLVFLGALFCAGWTLAVSSLVAYDEIGFIEYPSELPRDADSLHLSGFDLAFFDKPNAVTQALNVVLPIGLLCVGFLIYTWSVNPIGVGSLTVLAAVFLVAYIRILDAVQKVEQSANMDLALVVWWMH